MYFLYTEGVKMHFKLLLYYMFQLNRHLKMPFSILSFVYGKKNKKTLVLMCCLTEGFECEPSFDGKSKVKIQDK